MSNDPGRFPGPQSTLAANRDCLNSHQRCEQLNGALQSGNRASEKQLPRSLPSLAFPGRISAVADTDAP
jgi:hypothetical protein